jgi:hypothetical protein
MILRERTVSRESREIAEFHDGTGRGDTAIWCSRSANTANN